MLRYVFGAGFLAAALILGAGSARASKATGKGGTMGIFTIACLAAGAVLIGG